MDRIAALAPRPVWLFSSGPIGDPPKPDEEPAEVADMIKTTNAHGHRLFAGRLDRHRLGFGEKAVIMALRVPDGDFRGWDAIQAWSTQIAEELTSSDGMPELRQHSTDPCRCSSTSTDPTAPRPGPSP